MLYPLKTVWTVFDQYQDPQNPQISGYIYHAERFEFDSATRMVQRSDYDSDPGQNYYDQVLGGGFYTPPPEDYSRPLNDRFFTDPGDHTNTGYFHDGDGGVQLLTLELRLQSLICYGAGTGNLVLTVSGTGNLVAPFTFLWSDGPTTQVRGLVAAGRYSVTVTHPATGAACSISLQATQNPELIVLIQKTGKDVTLLASGGTAPYTYVWDDGATTAARTNMASGTYLCVITDAVGCTKDVLVRMDAYQFYWSRNPITLPLDAGEAYRDDPATKPNLSFLCEVWIEKVYLSGTFEQIGTTLEQPANREGRTVFQVQSLLDAFLEHHVPDPGQTGARRADPMFRRFYLKYAENYGEPPVRSGTSILEQNYVVLGGLDFYESRARTWFNSYQDDVRPFLTWEPPTKEVLADQPEYLYYMVRQPGAFRCQVKVFFHDGSWQLDTYWPMDTSLQHEVYCLPVGYTQLGLAHFAAEEKKVVSWEVFVVDEQETIRLSETRTFILDEQVYPRRRYFLFATSLGGMATFAALGQAQLEVEVTGEESTLVLPHDYHPLQGDTAVQSRALRPVLKVAAGKRRKQQILRGNELLLSRRVLLLNGERWLPGYIKAKTSNLLDESKNVLTQEFEFYLPYQQLYTPLLGSSQVVDTTTQQP